MAGVAKTSREPLPIFTARFDDFTIVSALPTEPILISLIINKSFLYIIKPPFTPRICPVINLDFSDAKK